MQKKIFYLSGVLLIFLSTMLQAEENSLTSLAGPIELEISTDTKEYSKPLLDADGKFIPYAIPIHITLTNSSSKNWTAPSMQLILEVTARGGGLQESQEYLISAFPIVLEPNLPWGKAIEAGEFLSRMASGYIKGDELTVQARMEFVSEDQKSIEIFSDPIELKIFIPEG